ncbi:MAG TPA: PAS domain S-box protein [Leptolyngbyaceae cyanobacterium]
MQAEEPKVKAENSLVGGELGALLRACFAGAEGNADWSQTPLGPVEIWSDDLKTAVRILATELERAKLFEKPPLDTALPQDGSALAALHQANQLNKFRVKLADALRPLTDASEIQAIAARTLGEALGATRVIYIEVVSAGEEVIVRCNYTNGVAELSGRYRLEDYKRNLSTDHDAGRTQVVTDIPNNPNYTDAQKAKYREIEIAAHIDVPLVKNNEFVALFAVQQSTPRQWTETEIKLAEETAESTWAAVERARAEAALRASEAKYRTLFESIDEGFCIVEMLFGENNTPIDYRFLEVNSVFGQQTGLQQPVGKTARELVPDLEDFWIETYGKVALTGESIRFENRSAPMNRWFDVYACRAGQPQDRKVAIVFKDISDRKRAEDQRKQAELNAEFLATVTQALIEATCVDDILQTVGEQLNRYLKTSRCAFIEINESADEAVIQQDWHREDVLSLAGVYRLPEFLEDVFFQTAKAGKPIVVRDVSMDVRIADPQKFAALNIGSFINVPLLKDGKWKFTFGAYHQEPYNWRTDEIELMRELANRIWTMLERAHAESALRQSEERFRLMADAVPQIVWITDADGRVEFFNKQWSNYTGVPYEPTTAAEVAANFLHPEDGDRTIEAFNEAQRSGSIFSVEHRVRSAAGTYRWFLVRAEPYRDPQTGEVIRWFGASIDIHDRKQAEANLQESEARYRLLAEAIPQFVWITDADGQNEYVNQRFCDYTGLTSEQMYGLNWLSIIHPDDLAMTRDLWLTAVRTGQFYEVEYRFRAQDGSYRWFLGQGIPLKDEQGRIRQWFGTCTDIEPQKQIEQTRLRLLEREQAAREQAEHANRIKDEFLAVLSHELRSPLNPILGWARLLQNSKLDAERQREALATIERNAKLQTQLIEDLLDISRIMRGKLSLTVVPVDLTFVISAAVETVRLAAEAKNIPISLDLDPGVAFVSGDAARLQQVVWNLLTNAVKFTPSGGQVIVELRQLAQLAQIRVIDMGKGINPQFLPHVFEYFRQEDGSTTRKFGGLGLGLAIARQIVEMHGGTVWAESLGEGQGATFVVQLPMMPQTTSVASESTQSSTDTGLPLKNIQILLVDDELDTREFQAFLLEQNGASVTAVASGLEALQALEQSIPDVIVSDIGMAQMNGYMLLQQLRSRSPEQGGMIPAIALTAYATEMDQQQALQAGFQTHLKKPVEPEELVRAIVTLLQEI